MGDPETQLTSAMLRLERIETAGKVGKNGSSAIISMSGQVGEQCLNAIRAQRNRMSAAKKIENILLEVLHPELTVRHPAGAAGAQRNMTIGEPVPAAKKLKRKHRRGWAG